MASAKRLMEFRHGWFSRSKIAEISVPAWPIPIHQTKLVIGKAQATGMLFPKMPTPVLNSATTPVRKIKTRVRAAAKLQNQIGGTSGEVTMVEICSVTLWNVVPGATIATVVPGPGG